MAVDLTHEARRQVAHLWGQKHIITPRVIDWIHGDGLKVIWFAPTNTRPNYYIARIDSALPLDNHNSPCFADEVLDELRDEIRFQYGDGEEEWTSDKNGRTYVRHNYFPALNDDCGSSWGQIGLLAKPDKRTEQQIRKAIRRRCHAG